MNQDQEQRILESVLELEARRQADAKELLCKWWSKDDVLFPFPFSLSSLAMTITVTVTITVYAEKSTVVSYRNDAYHPIFTIDNVHLVLTIDKVHPYCCTVTFILYILILSYQLRNLIRQRILSLTKRLFSERYVMRRKEEIRKEKKRRDRKSTRLNSSHRR